MVYRRIEPTPAEQLKALCQTRDHYVALADQLHENTDPLLNPEIKLAEERNARRIAHAYEKSVANSMVRMSSMRQTHKFTLPSLRTRTWLMFFIAISAIEGALLLAYFRPAFFQFGAAAPQPTIHRLNRIASLPPKPSAQLQMPIAIAPKPRVPLQAPIAIAPRPRIPLQASIAIAPKPRVPLQAPIAIAPRPAAPKPPPPVTVVLQPSVAPPVVTPATPPPPLAAAVPQPSTQPAPAAPIATFTVPAPPAPATPTPQAAAPVQPSTRLEPVRPTHTLPPYPAIARSLGEEGITQMRVAISVQGAVTDCEILKSSGSTHLDAAACGYVQDHWRWNPPMRNGQPVTASTQVSIVWNLKSAR